MSNSLVSIAGGLSTLVDSVVNYRNRTCWYGETVDDTVDGHIDAGRHVRQGGFRGGATASRAAWLRCRPRRRGSRGVGGGQPAARQGSQPPSARRSAAPSAPASAPFASHRRSADAPRRRLTPRRLPRCARRCSARPRFPPPPPPSSSSLWWCHRRRSATVPDCLR